MNYTKIVIGIIGLMNLVAVVGAQAKGEVTFALGKEFSLQSGAIYRSYQLGKDNVIGLELKQGDMLSTGPDTSIEVKFSPSGNILKVVENTTVRVTDLAEGKGGLEVIYGRIRAKVAKLGTGESFNVKGATVVAGVRGTDFGYDVVLVPGGAGIPQAQVYCFEGSVSVSVPDVPLEEPVLVQAGQIIVVKPTGAVGSAGPGESTFARGKVVLILTPSMPQVIEDFWLLQDDKESGAVADPSGEVVVQTVIEPDQVAGTVPHKSNIADNLPPLPVFTATDSLSSEQYVYGLDWKKHIGMVGAGTGLGIGLVSALVGAYGYEIFGLDRTLAATMGQVGILSGLGLGLGGTGLFLWGLSER